MFELKQVAMRFSNRLVQGSSPQFPTGLILLALFLCLTGFAQQVAAKVLGTVKSVSGNSLVLTTDAGLDVTVTVADGARIVHATPGQDLKSAPQIQLSDIQVGDRVLAIGPMEGQISGTATSLLVMKQSDVADVHQKERDEWRRGVGGIVKEVDPSASTITIANSLAAGGKPIVIHIGPKTDIKRYAPDSVKFDDAKPGSLDQIKAGDQVRARGTKSADGTEFTAQAIVSGSFRDIAGTVISTDATSNSITISDLATRKPVTIKVGPDSQLRKLPPFVAMRIAMRLKGGAPGAAGPGGAAAGETGSTQPGPGGGGQVATEGGNRSWQGGQGGGPPDFQQMLARMPAVSVSELNKGDAVMLVATEGTATSQPTAITLLSGVEPILTAAPAGTNASTILSPWNLGQQPAGGDAATQ